MAMSFLRSGLLLGVCRLVGAEDSRVMSHWSEDLFPKRGDSCNGKTDGSCRWAECNAWRNAVCSNYDGGYTCDCGDGMCAVQDDANGGLTCRTKVTESQCCGLTWNMANVEVENHEDGSCIFTKTSGKQGDQDAWAISETGFIRGIQFGPGGDTTHERTVGLTPSPSQRETSNTFSWGVKFRLQEQGIYSSTATKQGAYHGDDVLNMTLVERPIPDAQSKFVTVYKNGVYVDTSDDGLGYNLPKAMAAKIIFTGLHGKVEIFGCAKLIDCELSAWSAWSSCSKTCGEGERRKSRTVITPGQNGGKTCNSPLEEHAPCQEIKCPIDCVWGDWGEWGGSSVTCGTGVRERNRNVTTEPKFNGKVCQDTDSGRNTDTKPDEGVCCPVDAVFSDWAEWSSCSVTCGPGSSTRDRHIAVNSTCGGAEVEGDTTEYQKCHDRFCPIDCEWDKWTPWSKCTAECSGGTQSRARGVLTEAEYSGIKCSGEGSAIQNCNEFPCNPVDCAWGEWSPFSECDKTCGGGTLFKSRVITKLAKFGGQTCEGGSTFSKTCHEEPCRGVVNCEFGPWQDWTRCSRSCDSGTSSRTRLVLQPAIGDGEKCADMTEETRECGLQSCKGFVNWQLTNLEFHTGVFSAGEGAGQAASPDAGEVAITVEKVGDGGSVTFGLTTDVGDSSGFENGFGYTLGESGTSVTVAIVAGNLVVYEGKIPKIQKPTAATAMYAKVFVANGAEAKLVDVVAKPLEERPMEETPMEERPSERLLPMEERPIIAPSTFALAATTSSESTYTRLVYFAAGMAVSMIIAVSLRLSRTPEGMANMREPLIVE